MAGTEIIKGVSTISWGIGQIATITGIKNQSATEKRKTEKAVVKDENGKTISVIYFDPTTEVSLKAVYNGYTFPAIGDTVAITPMTSGANFLCEEIDVEYANANEVRLTLTLKAYDGIS